MDTSYLERIQNLFELLKIDCNQLKPRHFGFLFIANKCLEDGIVLNLSSIAERFSISRAAVTQHVNKMIEQGVIEKYYHDGNKKNVYLRLTAEGLKRKAEFEQEYEKRLVNVIEKMGKERFEEFLDLFLEFRNYIEEERKEV